MEAEDASDRMGGRPAAEMIPMSINAGRQPPELTGTRIKSAKPGTALRIVAEAGDPSGIRWVRLRFRSVTQFQDGISIRALTSCILSGRWTMPATAPFTRIPSHYSVCDGEPARRDGRIRPVMAAPARIRGSKPAPVFYSPRRRAVTNLRGYDGPLPSPDSDAKQPASNNLKLWHGTRLEI